MKAAFRSVFLAVFAATAACTVHGTDVPDLAGPSEFGLSLALTATPDSISQDGASQSSIAVVARGPDGTAKAGVSIRVQTAVNGALQDYGTLSARTIVTGTDGRAVAVYTAPPPAASLGSGSIVTILVTPIGTNYQTATGQSAEIRLVPPGVVLPPASAPTPNFTVSPQPVSAGIAANFDASRSCASQSSCSSTAGITSFSWNFGDGSSGVGPVTAHTFAAAGSYMVTLTVTNDRGLTNSTAQAVSVSTSAEPTASLIVTPANPHVGTVLNFNADASRAAPGRTLVQYSWNWGDGTPAEVGGFLRQHAFAAAGTYTVVLSVLDDAGQKGTATATVTVLP